MKVLVTGASGFMGSWLTCHLLDLGIEVKALRRKNSDLRYFNNIYDLYFAGKSKPADSLLGWVVGDLNDIFSLEDAMENCEMVYHTAALVSFHKKDRELLNKTNVAGTRNLIDTMLFKNVKTLAYVSSTAALGRNNDGSPVNEVSPWQDDEATSAYSRSKHKAELEIWRGAEEGLNVVVVNPGIISGYGNWSQGSCATYKKIFNGLKMYSLGVNGVVDVRDVCRALIDLVNNKTFNRRFVIVAKNLTYQEYFNLIAKGFGKEEMKIQISPTLGKLAGKLAAILETVGFKNIFITREIAHAAISDCRYDSSAIINELDFKFTSIEESTQYATRAYMQLG